MSESVTITSAEGFEVESHHGTETAEQLQANFDAIDAPAAAPDAAPTEAAETPDAAAAKVEPPKVDRRSREGRKQSIQQEIDELTTQKHATKREAEAAAAEVAQLRAHLAELQQQRQSLTQSQAPQQRPQPVAALTDPEPTLDEFVKQGVPDPWAAHMRALGRWEARQEFNRQQQAVRQQQQLQQFMGQVQQAEQTYLERLNARLEKEPEFWKRIRPELADLRPTHYLQKGEPVTNANRLADEILISERPTELVEYLNDSPKEYQRLATLHPRDLVREIGKITARLDAAHSGPASTSPVLSAAKPPIKPVGGSLTVSDDDAGDDGDELSEAAVLRHFKTENARERKTGARR